MRKAVSAILVATATSAAVPVAALEKVTEMWLDNGMQVVVLEDHRAPIVNHMVWYRTGAADEPPGKSGIAHFVEHLMFMGTERFAPGEFNRIIKLAGGTDSAFTSLDFTAYVQRVASDRLETVMELEADRMTGLLLSEEVIETERLVVLEERNERTDTHPGSQLSELRSASLYLNHPYGIPTIGWRHEIEALDREDIFSFYDRYYAPNNAILIVAGDVQPDDVLSLAEKYYGQIPSSPGLPERVRPSEPPHLAERRIYHSDPRVSRPYVLRSYLAPERDPGEQEEAAALEMLAFLLGSGGINSVFGEKLELGEEIALHTAAYYRATSLDDTTFTVIVMPKDGVSLEEAEAGLDRAIASFLEEGVDPSHLDRAKAQVRAAWIYQQDDLYEIAFGYGESLTAGLNVADIADWPSMLDGVTEQDIVDAAKKVFDRKRSVTSWLMKEDSKT